VVQDADFCPPVTGPENSAYKWVSKERANWYEKAKRRMQAYWTRRRVLLQSMSMCAGYSS